MKILPSILRISHMRLQQHIHFDKVCLASLVYRRRNAEEFGSGSSVKPLTNGWFPITCQGRLSDGIRVRMRHGVLEYPILPPLALQSFPSMMSSETQGAPSVPVSISKDTNNPPKPSVWPLDIITEAAPSTLQTQCDRTAREGAVCCKDLKDGDNRTLIDPDVVRDIVIGLSDGLTVPFALTAGLSSLGQSRFVIMGGLAELIAGAISMGIGGFLASQAERDYYRFKKRQTSSRIHRTCMGETEREVFSILGPVGVDERTAQAVARCLRLAEGDAVDVGSTSRTAGLGDEEKQQAKAQEDVGLTSFVLRFGLGLEEIPTKRLYISAVTIGIGYLIGGIIPLIPYFFISSARTALFYSCIITGVILLIFGAIKARVTGAANTPLGYLHGAVSMLIVGGASAAAAYGMVVLLDRSYGSTST